MVPPKPPPHHQGKKHECFPPRHSQGAHCIGTSADTTDHPGLPLDLGNWDDSIRSRVHGMCTAVAGTRYVVTTNLKCGKHGGAKQGRVIKNWCPQIYIYIGQNMSRDLTTWPDCIFIYSNLLLNSILY